MINGIVLRNELYMARRSLLVSTAIIVVLMATFAGLSELILESSTGDMIIQLMDNIPPALLKAFNFDVNSLRSFEGWMASEPYTFYSLMLGIVAANGAAAVVAREIDQGTAESVVSLPLSRRTLFLSKVASHIVIVTVMAVASLGAALLAGYFTAGVANPAKIVTLLTAGYLTSLAFAGIGYALSPLLDGERTATSLGTGIVIGSFVIHILSTLSDTLSWVAYGSLFSLFDVNAVVEAASLPLLPCIVAVALFGAGIAIGAALFERKDIAV